MELTGCVQRLHGIGKLPQRAVKTPYIESTWDYSAAARRRLRSDSEHRSGLCRERIGRIAHFELRTPAAFVVPVLLRLHALTARSHEFEKRHALDQLHSEAPLISDGEELVENHQVRVHDVGQAAELFLEPVELRALDANDFVRILTEPKASLTEQYSALMATEGVELKFGEDSVQRIAEIAWQVNESTENIGARRLHTILERLLDIISYEAPDRSGETITLDAAYVDKHLDALASNEDLSRYIL